MTPPRRGRAVLKGLGLAAGAATAAYAGARFAAKRARRGHDPHVGRAFEPAVDAEHKIETDDGTVLHVVERGEGIPVVLGHGVTNDHRTWAHQLEDLPGCGIRAVAFDQRGHGRSTVGESGFGVPSLGDDLKAILEGLDLRGAVLVGHSMGGMGVQALACRHPDVVRERVAGLVLMSTSSHAFRVWRALDRIPARMLDGSDVWFDRLMLHDDLGYWATRLGLGATPSASHVELVRRMVLECPVETRRGATRSLVDYDLRELLCDVAVPTLVVCGTRDLLTPPAASRVIADAIPQAALRLLPRAGHMPMLERADEVTELIADFAHEVSGALGRPSAIAGASELRGSEFQ